MTSQEKLQKLIERYGGGIREKMLDPIFFINEICGVGSGEDKLNEYQEEWVKLVHQNKLLNIIAFRSSGKTECLAVSYPIFKAFTQAGWWGILVSDKEEQAKEILQRIKNKIQQNPLLSTSIPKNKDVSWSKTELNLTNGSRILAKPYTDRLRGWHVNWAMFDEAGEYRDLDIFESNAFSITQSRWELGGAGICVTGTPKSELDLLHTLQKNIMFKSEIFPANYETKEGKTLWQIRYPQMTLEQKKHQINNNIKFTREFLCKVLSSGDELFPYWAIEAALDYDYGFDDNAYAENVYYMGLDFALSGESGADYSAYSIFQRSVRTGVIRLVKLERYKGLSYAAQKLRIQQLCDLFHPVKVIADEGTFGKSFIQELLAFGIPIKGFKFQHKRQELLEVFRAAFDMNFQSVTKATQEKPKPLPVAERKFFINYGKHDLKCVKIVDELIKELLGFGVILETSGKGDMTGRIKFESVKRHDDLVMACALGWWGVQKRQADQIFVHRGSTPKGARLMY